MKRGNKRGLSPVIASVLMIMLVLVLAAMIFLWARGFISEQIEKFGKPVEDLCADVDLTIFNINNKELEVKNDGNIDIWHLDVKMFDADGNSEISKFDFPIHAGKAVREPVTLLMGDDKKTKPYEIIVYPALLGNIKGKSSNQAFTCTNAGVTL